MLKGKPKIKNNPIISFYQQGTYFTKEKIYAFGDIHGDLSAFLNVLKMANLINNQLNWCGGKSHVVQVGDILDRKIRTDEQSDEDSEFIIVNLIIKLKVQAFVSGGAFHTTIGNHELMNIMGIFDYVSPLGFKQFHNNPNLRKEYFKIGGPFCKNLSYFWNPIIKINNYLFCHGGITSTIANKYPINIINNIMRDTLAGNAIHFKQSYFSELFLDNSSSILWNRTFSIENYKSSYYNMYLENELDKIFKKYNVSCLIIGHTPQEGGISYKFNNKVICIDTAMSEAFGKKKNKLERIQHIVIHPVQNKVFIIGK